jgi:hypothetical protein
MRVEWVSFTVSSATWKTRVWKFPIAPPSLHVIANQSLLSDQVTKTLALRSLRLADRIALPARLRTNVPFSFTV